MSASDSEPTVTSSSEPQRQTVAEPIRATVVSMRWLVVGIIGLLGLAGIAVAMYSIQSSSLSSKILNVVQRMVEEADRDKAKMEEVSSDQEKAELIRNSLKRRGDAANLLNNFRQTNRTETGSAVLEKLFEILDSLYTDYGGYKAANGKERWAQLTDVAAELMNTVSDVESLKYRTRLLELAWDRGYFPEIISRGLALLTAAQAAGDTGDARYNAMRFLAMALFDNLPVGPYQPSLHKLPQDLFPETMDELLDKLIAVKPDDIDIARRSAAFIMDAEESTNYQSCASDALLGKSPEERRAAAKSRIDDMVQRNQNNPIVYISRYNFLRQYDFPKGELDQADPDLEMARKLAPTLFQVLILSAQDAAQQMVIANRNNEPERFLEWEKRTEEYYRNAVKYNPSEPMAYQYLGDFLLFIKKQPNEAVDVWEQGLKLSNNSGDEELIGRLVLMLLPRRTEADLAKVRQYLEHLTRTIADMQYSAPSNVRRTSDMQELLTAQLYYTEAEVASVQSEVARREKRTNEVRRLNSIVQQKQGDALQKFDRLLRNFGKSPEDYNVFNVRSAYNLLVPQCLLQAGELHAKWQQWDAAISYFERSSRFELGNIKRTSLLALAEIFGRRRQFDRAAQMFQAASTLDPNNLSLRLDYVKSLFRAQSASSNPSVAVLDNAQRELDTINARRDELARPWMLDILRIQMGRVRADATNLADNITQAWDEAIRQFRTLEQGSYPPDAEGNTRKYIDDPDFVFQMADVYSGLSARSDFDRMLLKLREFPNVGEAIYFHVKVNDFYRRDDYGGMSATIDEALTSTRLSAAQKEQFAVMLQALKNRTTSNVSAEDREYDLLTTTFDNSPEDLTPPLLFALARESLERDEVERTKAIMERLRKLEGPEGRYWQYIEVRIMLTEPDPDFVMMRQKQDTLVKIAPEWDETYALRALIEELFLARNPGDPNTTNQLIASYQLATQNGSTDARIWLRLIDLLESAGRTEESSSVQRTAVLRGVPIQQQQQGEFPSPYGHMYSQVLEAIGTDDAIGADGIAQQCITLAERRGENPKLISSLDLVLGQAFLDAAMYDSALRHFSSYAKPGGIYIYPLTSCLIRSGNVDNGYTLLLDEIDRQPSLLESSLLSQIIRLLTRFKPSDAVCERFDRLMERLEQGEKISHIGIALDSPEGNLVPLGTQWTPYRKLKSLVIRFPEKAEEIDPSAIQFIEPVTLKPTVSSEQPQTQQPVSVEQPEHPEQTQIESPAAAVPTVESTPAAQIESDGQQAQ